MAHLLKAQQAIVYWDVDLAYFTPPKDKWNLSKEIYTDKTGHLTGEEPGKFIREYHSKWQDLASRLIISDMGSRDKDIHLTGVPLQVGQAQYIETCYKRLLSTQNATRARHYTGRRGSFGLHSMPSAENRAPQHHNGISLEADQYPRSAHQGYGPATVPAFSPSDAPLVPIPRVIDLLNNPYLKAQAPELSPRLQDDHQAKSLVCPAANARKCRTPNLTSAYLCTSCTSRRV